MGVKLFAKKTKYTYAIIISGILLLIVILALVIFSFLNPYSNIGYRTIFIDSKSNTYKIGEDFNYGKYIFNIKTQITSGVVDNLNDCSSLYYGGIFNKNSNNAPEGQNWWPKESCEEANTEKENIAKSEKYLKISYKIKNNTNDVDSLTGKWLIVISDDGSTIFESNSSVKLISKGEVSGIYSKKLENDSKANGIILKLPGLASQTVAF